MHLERFDCNRKLMLTLFETEGDLLILCFGAYRN